MRNMRFRRKSLLIGAAVIAALLAVAMFVFYLWGSAEDAALRRMKPYTAEQQQRHAEALIAGLNARDPNQANLYRPSGDKFAPALARITRNIKAAMPNPGCHYVLTSVHDDGEQGEQAVGWRDNGKDKDPTYRYDMFVTEICPAADPIPLKIGVIAVPSGMAMNWADAALTVEQ